jgi:hypothetical protein
MAVCEVIAELQSFFLRIVGREIQVISVVPTETGWNGEFEVVVEDDYMRRRGRKDIIAKYEVSVGKDMTVTSYTRKELRERGSLE